MKTSKFTRDFLMVLASNTLVLLSSIFTGLVIPKLMGVTDYGYYKLFMLYLGYTAPFHFGYVDGVLLIHGGKEYQSLDKARSRLETVFFIRLQAALSALFLLAAVIMLNGHYRFLFVVLSIDAGIVNVTAYYQSLSQATMRFKELSIRKVIQSAAKIMIVLAALVLHSCGLLQGLNA